MSGTTASHRDLIGQLSGARKSNRGAGGYSRWVNRPVGRHFAAMAFRLGLSPNGVSAASACFTFPGIAALAVFAPSWTVAVLVCLCLLVGYGLDSADGQLARLRGGGSYAGEWLDHVLDAAKTSAFHLSIAVLWYRFYPHDHRTLILIPLVFAAAILTMH